MLQLIAGIAGGMVSALGMGGGTILILILSLFFGIEQHVAQATNIIFYTSAATIAIIINLKNKMINWKFVTILIIFGIIGAIIGAQISIRLETATLKRVFGIFLALIVFYEIYIFVKKK